MMEFNKGIERLILLLSILVGTTIVVITAQSDYTLGGSFHTGAEIVLGHLFLWTSGFAGVWIIYGAAIFLVKGFSDVTVNDTEEIVVDNAATNYHPLPEKKVQKVLAPPMILSWKEQIDRVRRASSRQRIRLIDTDTQTKTDPRPARNTVSGDKMKFHCRFCSQKIIVPKIHAGKRGQCLKCKKILLIPGGKPKVAIGTGMSAVSQVLAKAKRQAESRKLAWNNIQDEIAVGNKNAEQKSEVKAQPTKPVEVAAPVVEEKARTKPVVAEQTKDVASAIEQVKAEANARAKELTDAMEKLKAEMEDKIRAQATAAAEIVVAEARAHAEPAKKPKAKAKAKITKPKAKPKAKAKPKTTAKAKITKPKTKPKKAETVTA